MAGLRCREKSIHTPMAFLLSCRDREGDGALSVDSLVMLRRRQARPSSLSPELQTEIMKSIAAGSDALIKPFPPALPRDARRLRPPSERQIDRGLLIGAVLGVAAGSLLKWLSLPHISWSAVILVAFGTLTLLSGILALVEVPEIYDHRVCRRCGYPFDEEAQPDRCPECGSDLRGINSVGYWRPWRPKLRKYLSRTMLIVFVAALVAVVFS